MRLIVGGRAQGKRAYLLTQTNGPVADGATCPLEELETAEAVDGLHLLARRWLELGLEPTGEALRLAKRPGIILVCDEVGCGIVPMERGEREWREAVGRMCCALAQRADLVERIVCGIPVTLKRRDGI